MLEEQVSKTALSNWVKALVSSEPSAPFPLSTTFTLGANPRESGMGRTLTAQ